MKTRHISLSAITTLILLCACKKDNSPTATAPARLASFVKELERDTSTTMFDYDALGRIARIDLQPLHGATFTEFDVVYNGNEIRLTNPVQTNSFSITTDTIQLFMDADNRLVKRIQKLYYEYTADPTYNPRSYTWDTTTYQYNAAELVTREIHSKHDSSWSWVGMETMQDNRSMETIDHIVQNGNVMSTSGLKTGTGRGFTPSTGNVVNSSSTLETSTSFRYDQNYPNNGDFANQAVLNEVFIFDAIRPNKNYKNVPNHIIINQVQKEKGTIVNSQNFMYDYYFEYDAIGNIKTMGTLGPFMKRIFNYTTP